MKLPRIMLFLVAVTALIVVSIFAPACIGPKSTVKAQAQHFAKQQSKVSVNVATEVRTTRAETVQAVLVAPTKMAAALPATRRIDLVRSLEYPARNGYRLAEYRPPPKPDAFNGLGRDHFARADV